MNADPRIAPVAWPKPQRTARIALSLAAFLLAPFSWFLAIDQPWLRATGASVWVLLLVALALAWSAAAVDRRRWVRLVVVGELVLAGLFLWLFFGFSRLPAGVSVAQAADFTLPDENGRPVTLSAELARGPVLLVFYRGHW